LKTKYRENKIFIIIEIVVFLGIIAALLVMLAPNIPIYIEKSKIASNEVIANEIYDSANEVIKTSKYKNANLNSQIKGNSAKNLVGQFIVKNNINWNNVIINIENINNINVVKSVIYNNIQCPAEE